MEFFNRIITHYGWEGTALAGVLLVMFGIQLYYYLFVYGRIPKYKDTRRPEILSETPPVSVVIPLFSEDYAFVEEILPLIVAQEYPDFEVVIVYVAGTPTSTTTWSASNSRSHRLRPPRSN